MDSVTMKGNISVMKAIKAIKVILQLDMIIFLCVYMIFLLIINHLNFNNNYSQKSRMRINF